MARDLAGPGIAAAPPRAGAHPLGFAAAVPLRARSHALGLAAATVALAALAAVSLAAAAPPSRRAPRAAPSLAERVHADSLRFSRGVNKPAFDSLGAIMRRDIAEARRVNDPAALEKLLGLIGVGHALAGDGAAASAALDEALALGRANPDTTWVLTLLRFRAYSAGMLGRYDEQQRFAERLIAIAEARGDERFIAVGHNFLGWIERQRGQLRAAQRHLERAVEAQRRLDNETDEAIARTAYGAVLMDLGEFAAARRSYERQLDIARRLNLGWTEAQAWNDLALLETLVGDPSLAAEHLRRAYELHRARGETPDAAQALFNLAAAELRVGHAKNAGDLGRQGLEMSVRRGFQNERANFIALLASVEEAEGRPAAAERQYRAVMALGDTASPTTRAIGLLGVCRSLEAAGRDAEALALLEPRVPELLSRLPREEAAELRLGRSKRLFGAGRLQESLEDLLQVVGDDAIRASAIQEGAWGDLAVVRERLGQVTAAATAYDSACVRWERRRGRTRDLEWRASEWSTPSRLATHFTGFLLRNPAADPESTRIAAAWERAQYFCARTLLERVTGGTADGSAPALAARILPAREVQSRLLAPGELLLEWVAVDDEAVLFAFTNGECRAFRMDYPRDIRARIESARAFLAGASHSDADARAQEQVAREMAKTIFGPALPLVERASSLWLVPDGPIHLAPFAALIPRSIPLGVTHAIAIVPSVAVLAEARSRAGTGPAGGLLALATGSGGARLAGAASEVRWLASAFEGVTSRGPGESAPEPATLAEYEALHFAGHTALDDRFPWRSGIDLGGGEGAAPDLLRAETIARLPLHARLVVLSSCESAGGTVASGEGVSGLTTAFVAAGASTVVASLWPVDDRATETLMREFYRRLAMGLPASAALREAQALVRRSGATRDPHYWAGFEVFGDGRTRLALKPSPPWRRWVRG